MNPYKILSRKAQLLLGVESKMSPEDRKANEWYLLVQFDGILMTVGKGGVNTLFIKLGAHGRRRIGYPDEVIGYLEKLASQKFVFYVASSGKTFFSEKAALNGTPPAGVIQGIDSSGKKHIVYKAKPTLSGVQWVKL